MLSKAVNAATSSRSRTPLLWVRTWIVLRAVEFQAYFHDVNAPPRQGHGNVLIFAQGRTGTTLLESLICSTGEFEGFHEALNTVTREVMLPVKFLRGLSHRQAPSKIVVHVKPMHLQSDRRRPVEISEFLREMHTAGWTIVHLSRRNTLEQTLSLFLAEARGGFHKTDNASEDIQFYVPPELFLERIRERQRSLRDERAVLSELPHLALNYEDDLQDPSCHQLTIDRLRSHMGLPISEVKATGLRRIRTRPSENYISNAAALKQYLAANGIEWPK